MEGSIIFYFSLLVVAEVCRGYILAFHTTFLLILQAKEPMRRFWQVASMPISIIHVGTRKRPSGGSVDCELDLGQDNLLCAPIYLHSNREAMMIFQFSRFLYQLGST